MRLTQEQTQRIIQTVFRLTGEGAEVYLFGSRLNDKAKGSARTHHLTIVNRLRKAGFNTIWISDPPVDLRNIGYYSLVDQILSEKYQAIDSLPFLAAEWISHRYGILPSEFLSTEIDPSTGQLDVHHGSLEYYRQLMKEIFSRFSIKPQYRQTACVPNHSASSQANISAPDNGNSTSCD